MWGTRMLVLIAELERPREHEGGTCYVGYAGAGTQYRA